MPRNSKNEMATTLYAPKAAQPNYSSRITTSRTLTNRHAFRGTFGKRELPENAPHHQNNQDKNQCEHVGAT
jgi:hypothetical protein